MQEELSCLFCSKDYDLERRMPRKLLECEHSICQKCLQDFISYKFPIHCPRDDIMIEIEEKTIFSFPIDEEVK